MSCAAWALARRRTTVTLELVWPGCNPRLGLSEKPRGICVEKEGYGQLGPDGGYWPIHTFREHGPLAGVQLDVDLWAGWISDFSSDLNVEKSERNDPQF